MLLSAQQIPQPRKQFGASVTGAFEGWFANQDGSRSFLVGYFNRNTQQELDIPIGPNNRFEPGGPDLGQPTHFLPGRQFGIFVGTVPFDKAKPEVEQSPSSGSGAPAFSGKATANVTFSEPGEYVLHVTANDYSGEGGGGFQCCWTTGLMKVSVKP